MARAIQKEKSLSKDELFILRMTWDRPMSWATLYCKAVDTLFKRELIKWHYKDDRGNFYSTIIATDEGIKQYASTDEGKKRC